MEHKKDTFTPNTNFEHTNHNMNEMVLEEPKPLTTITEAIGSGTGTDKAVQVVKRGRGRPRKYDVNGGVLNPTLAPPGFSYCNNNDNNNNKSFEVSGVKKSRGRPRGSGKLQILASALDGYVSETAGENFTPYVMIVNIGENVVTKILNFFRSGPHFVCILSATGAVSSVELRQTTFSGGFVKYEGRFEILSLSGSYIYPNGTTSVQQKEGILCISLAKPDGTVFGGTIDKALIAASPIQLVMATFKQNITKHIIKRKLSLESSIGVSPPNMSNNHDAESDRNNKVPKLLLEREQNYPAPPTTIVPKIIATEGAMQDCVATVAATTTNNEIVDNDIVPATIPINVVVPHVVITEDLNMDSVHVDDGNDDVGQKPSTPTVVVDANNVPPQI